MGSCVMRSTSHGLVSAATSEVSLFWRGHVCSFSSHSRNDSCVSCILPPCGLRIFFNCPADMFMALLAICAGVLHYVCNAEAQAAQEQSSKKAAQEMYTAQILKVEEPAKCNYRITVHVLALCQLPEFGSH